MLRTSDKLVLVFLLMTCLCLQGASLAAEKSQLKSAEFVLQTIPKDAGIVRDGKIVEPSFKPIRGKPGFNEVFVSAPGYGMRKIRFWLKTGERRTLIVNLAKIRKAIDPEWRSIDKPIAQAKLAKMPSICMWYQEKTNDSSVCRRHSFFEDIAFAEPSLYSIDDMRSLASKKMLDTYRELLNRSLSDDSNLENRVEELYQQFPENSSVFQLTAAIALKRGDCSRIHSLFVDAQQVLESTYPLLIYKAMCLEMQGQNEAATMLLQESIRSNRTSVPYLNFHLGRLLLKKYPEKSLELADSCLKNSRFDLSCQELGLMSARLLQKPYKVQRFNLEEGTFKTYQNLEEGLPKGQAEALFLNTIPLVNTYPHSLEFYLFLAWIDTVQKIPGGLDFYARKMQVGSSLSGSSLDTLIDGLEKQNLTQLLTPVYRSKLRLDSQDPNLWLRLIRAHSKAEQCPEVLQAAKDGEKILPKYNVQLLQIEADCFVQLNRPKEAIEIYIKILAVQPKIWSTHYNLAALYERTKQNKEALDRYKQAAQLNPPPELKDGINLKITELGAAASSGKLKDKNPGNP